HEHRITHLESRIRARIDRSRYVDAADERKPAHDLSRAGRRERVLVIHARVRRLDDDGARAQVVQGQIDNPARWCPTLVENSERLERIHQVSATAGGSWVRLPAGAGDP